MPKLRFQALIELYEKQETEVRCRMGGLERMRADLVARIDALVAERDAVIVSDTRLRDIYLRFCQLLADQMAQIKEQIARLDKDIAACRVELIEAHRKTTTFAKLRQRDALAQARAAERRQARLLDELGVRRWAEAQA